MNTPMGMGIQEVCMNSLTLKTKGEGVHTNYLNSDSLWKMLKGFNTSYIRIITKYNLN
jgi:hypothetical protein